MYRMNLALDPSLGAQYKSMSQKARVITESWVENEMFCPSCDSSSLERLPHGTEVRDFQCPECSEQYQCKSLAKDISNRILDSAYEAMVNAILTNRLPNLLILHYSRSPWEVCNLLLIPRHLLSISAIEKRRPLNPSARRAGWVGCNILIDGIPESGRIFVVKDRVPSDPETVRLEWRQFAFLERYEPERRGWLVDILACIQSLKKDRFSLHDVYEFEDELSASHPNNKNVRPKIRQQLQVLRDRGVLRFVAKGVYEIAEPP